MIKLSIIIPVYNNYYYTNNALNNLIKLDKKKFEIIVIDNASTDETERGIKEFMNYNNIK